MNLLAIDPASTVGWALWTESDDRVRFGEKRLPTLSHGQTMGVFRDWLGEVIFGNTVTDICVEEPFISQDSPSAAKRLYGLYGIVHEQAFVRQLKVRSATAAEWRSFYLNGITTAPKSVKKEKRRKWIKTKAMQEGWRRGWEVSGDNEADALGIMVFYRALRLPEYAASGGLFGNGPVHAHPDSKRV
ncbi:MAG: hypothetical protein AB7F96_15380 [Beijerinckiaceae bacterium]